MKDIGVDYSTDDDDWLTAAALDGKVALITGGSKGIGFAIAETLVSRGARVMITGRNAADLERAQSRLGPDALSA